MIQRTREAYDGPLAIGEDLMAFEIGENGQGGPSGAPAHPPGTIRALCPCCKAENRAARVDRAARPQKRRKPVFRLPPFSSVT